MVPATLIYNAQAGGIHAVTPETLQAALREAGYQPVYRVTSSETDLDQLLAEVEGLIVVAGGDGTLRAVATRVIGKNVALSVLPLGTANNVATALGFIQPPLEIVSGLTTPRKRYMDIGVVTGPWGKNYFLEGVGWGFFAEALAEYGGDEEKNLWRAITSTIKTLTGYTGHFSQLRLDGQDLAGEYLLVEVMNTPAVGPHLRFAPEAKLDDGLLDILCIRQDVKDSFFSYLAGLATEELAELPSVSVKQGHSLELEWTGFTIHIDAELHFYQNHKIQQSPSSREQELGRSQAAISTVRVEIIPQALEFWLPAEAPLS